MGVLDLNADLGEGCGDDEALLRVVSSANVACGFHAGDPDGIRHTVETAAARGVVIGAHVAYPDREGFGRRDMELSHGALVDVVVEQLRMLGSAARSAGSGVAYVKPHGALYNRIVRDRAQAEAVVEAIVRVDARLGLLCLPGSTAHEVAAAHGVRTLGEVFADRAYHATGELAPRSTPGAVLHDPEVVAERVVRMATRHEVEAVDGTVVSVVADSVCVHGDTPQAVRMALAVRARLAAAGVRIASPYAEVPQP
jgi:UPF0271 protein